MLRLTTGLVLAALLAPGARAQTLTAVDLAQGSPASFVYDGGTPGGFAFLVLGFGGIGPGPCFDVDACWNLFPPLLHVATAPIDGGGVAVLPLSIPSSVPAVSLSAQVLEAVVAGATLDYATSNALPAAIAPIGTLGDDFESGALGSAWTVLHPELGTVAIEDGRLVLAPAVGGLPNMWFHDGEGLAVLRPVVGDFELSCDVLVHAPGDETQPPATGYRLAGLLIRDPNATAPGTHEWCHVAAGTGGAGEPAGAEWKHTHDSFSFWSIVPTADTHRELRLLRQGATITAWQRAVGAGAWSLLQTYSFPDLPGLVQVGAMAYSNSASPDVVARFERIDLALP